MPPPIRSCITLQFRRKDSFSLLSPHQRGQIDTYKPFCTLHRPGSQASSSVSPGTCFKSRKQRFKISPAPNSHTLLFYPGYSTKATPRLLAWELHWHSHSALQDWRTLQPIRTLNPDAGANPRPEPSTASTPPPLPSGGSLLLSASGSPSAFHQGPLRHLAISGLKPGAHSNQENDVSGRDVVRGDAARGERSFRSREPKGGRRAGEALLVGPQRRLWGLP